jgi:hypothetical protein
MIGMQCAIEEVDRMGGLNYAPPEGRATKELLQAIMTADTPQIASAAISLWIESQPKFPTPSEIRRIISEKNSEHRERVNAEQRPQHNCSECQDGGMRGGKLQGRAAGPWEFCSCRAGERLRAKDPQAVEESNVIREKLLGMAQTKAVA